MIHPQPPPPLPNNAQPTSNTTSTTLHPPPPTRTHTGLTLLSIMLSLTVLVWVVTESMLHSKRLTDGYGPYLNAGYNGLQSVVIFRSWGQFLMFNVVVVFLGAYAIAGALRR